MFIESFACYNSGMKKQQHVLITGGLQEGEWEEDNCAICRVMAQAEREGRDPTHEEVEEAFAQAKKDGALVGNLQDRTDD